MKPIIVAATAVLAASGSAATPEAKSGLDMVAFFTGRTHADNVMKIALHDPKQLVVDSVGSTSENGNFVLVDTVHEEGKPVRTRKWVMRPSGANRFVGLLSDASGPVEMVANGNGATIRYTMKDGGLKIVQQVELRDGKTLSNHVVARKFGLKFATVDGTIRKLD